MGQGYDLPLLVPGHQTWLVWERSGLTFNSESFVNSWYASWVSAPYCIGKYTIHTPATICPAKGAPEGGGVHRLPRNDFLVPELYAQPAKAREYRRHTSNLLRGSAGLYAVESRNMLLELAGGRPFLPAKGNHEPDSRSSIHSRPVYELRFHPPEKSDWISDLSRVNVSSHLVGYFRSPGS